MYKNNYKRGFVLTTVIVYTVIATIIITALTSWFAVTLQASRTLIVKEQAFQVAEAGIEYYRWHLAHDADDYRDGTGTGTSTPVSPIPTGLILWLDARDINGDGSPSADNINVTNWADKSSRNNDALQIGSESVPKKVTDNGRAAVEFTSDQLRTTSNLYPTMPANDVEVYLVARTRSTGSNGYVFRTDGSRISLSLPWGDNDAEFDFSNTTTGHIDVNWGGSTANYYLWNFQNSTTEGKLIRRNSVQIASETENAPSAPDVRRMMIGRQYSSQANYQQVNISEMLVYSRTLTPEERATVEKYLDCKWGVTNRTDCLTYTAGETYGPFIHEFQDKDGQRKGQFELFVTAPPIGSTLVTIRSVGRTDANPNATRTLESRLAVPSFVKYAFAANADMRFGAGTEIFGPIHSNGGIRFDGLAHNVVSSARATYDDPDHSGNEEFGVHTHVSPTDPLPPGTPPDRFDVFEAGREFPVPAVDFDGMIADLSNMKTLAQTGGHYFAPSGALGYNIVLKDNDTFDLYRVTSLVTPGNNCTNVQNEDGWGTWSIQNNTLLGNYANPLNGIIFVEDNLWIEGKIKTARLTIAAATFPDTPSTRKSITLNKDLLYTNYDGTDTLGLIAQKNINAGLVSEDDLRVDAAMIARSGRAGRYYYRNPGCSPYHVRDTITLYGSIASQNRYGFAWTDGTGYTDRFITYDPNLLYAPPPHFPLTTDQYEVVSWEEIK